MIKPNRSQGLSARGRKLLRLFGKIGAVLGVQLLLIVLGLYGVMYVLACGPSESARKLFVMSVKETSAVGFLANLYLPQQEIDRIMAEKAAAAEGETNRGTTDPGKIQIPSHTQDPPDQTGDSTSGSNGETPKPPEQPKEIEILPVEGKTYRGTMMIVRDPTRVFLGVLDHYGPEYRGMTLKQFSDRYDALACINAGGFDDPGGVGNGGTPTGILISKGKLLWGYAGNSYSVIGFDRAGILHVGTMTGQQALDAGIQDAVSFGPALIINGKPCNANYPLAGGMNPRTAIGQRADGAVLMLVINGRQIGSLGATMDDLVDVMQQFGAVNASNLDGGSSALMLYEGENVTSSAYVYGDRVIANAFMVARRENE